MDALDAPGTLTTRPLRFRGKYPFVNVDAKAGELRMEVLDADGAVIAPFSRENCVPMAVDSTRRRVEWKGAADLAPLAGKPVRFRFSLAKGKLYSFWVSPDRSGASHGYVAAGGPGFAGLARHDRGQGIRSFPRNQGCRGQTMRFRLALSAPRDRPRRPVRPPPPTRDSTC